jgi:glycosyltransferase involved in cell wall biosynthesis
MRVAVNLLFLLPGEVGGTEIYVRSLLAALQRLKDAPDLLLFTNRENHDTFSNFERDRIDIACSNRMARIAAEQFLLPRRARKANIDVLFSPGYTAPFYTACPQVVVMHDVQFLAHPEDFSAPARLAHGFFVQGAADVATAIVTPSKFAAGEVHERLGVPKEKVFACLSGVDPIFFEDASPILDYPYILYVANTYPHKNASTLVEAMDLLKGKIDHRLVIVGKPRAGEPRQHARLTRLDHVSQEELRGLYQNCSLYVSPSLYEGFGLPVVEAMASGARLLLSDIPAHRELAGDNAIYVDPRNPEFLAKAVLRLVPHDGIESDYARELVKSLSWDKCASQVLSVFWRVTEGR